jgi:hypothetical protein
MIKACAWKWDGCSHNPYGNSKRPVAEIRRFSEPTFFITNKSDGQHRHTISHARQW